jgi:hypothetical protein
LSYGIPWELVSKVLDPPVDFHTMTLSKTDSNVIIGFDSGGRGLFKTNDAGKTWEKLTHPEYISALAISHDNSQIIFAGTANGIFKSIDGGMGWSQVAYKGLAVYALNIDANGTLFGSVKTFGLVRSDDNGSSWTDLPDIDLTITSIALDPSNKIVYVAGFSSNGFQEVYKGTYDMTAYEIIGTNKKDQ